jgi:hypothetical protein
VTRISFLALAALFAAMGITVAAPRPDKPPVDLVQSAAFAPPRYRVENPEQRERVRKFLRDNARDSSETFSLRGNVLKLSRGYAERLAGEEGGAEKGSGRHRARLRLERAVGAGIEEGSPAFPTDYYPDDFTLQPKPQWPLENDGSLPDAVAGVDMNMARVWEQFDGADTLVIAVLDAGFNFLHPDLQNRWFVNQAEANGTAGVDDDHNGYVDDVRGWDFVDVDNDPQDYHGHGTQTGGLIAAGFDNGVGISGMLPRVKILPVRVLSTAGFGNTADIAGGIRYAAAMGAHVINFSIGIPGTATDAAMRNAFIVARDSGVIVAAASGNDHIDLDAATTQPASYKFDNVYVIGSHNQISWLSGFSNYGATTVDIAAPGEHIVTPTIPPGLPRFGETFENFNAAHWTFTGGTYQAAPDSMQAAMSLKWISGNTATATLNDTLDLAGKHGGLLKFRLRFTPASANDRVYVDAQKIGTTTWIPVGGTAGPVNDAMLSVNLGDVDDSRFRLRFQACVLNVTQTACSGTASTAARVLRIDDMQVTYADLDPQHQGAYEQDDGGTSLAAPYFAGYAGLMRLATDRMGIPLTRARMLAGSVPSEFLAGKVITGGRLDAAKGLDFYLRTLPRISVTDTTRTNWNPGATVSYALTVVDSAGPRNDFTFSPISNPPGSTLGSTGAFTWNSGGAGQAGYALRAKAVNGPITLRKLVRFTLTTAASIGAARPNQASVLRVGNRAFTLPAATFEGGSKILRLEFYGADGRTARTVVGELAIPAGARSVEYRLSGFQGVGLRAWLNGVPLRSANE